jgi:hypothetical protein
VDASKLEKEKIKMKKNIIALYCFLSMANSILAINTIPLEGSMSRCRDFIGSIVDENSQLKPVTFERVKKWKTYFKIIMNSKDKKENEIFLRLRWLAPSMEEVSNTLDEVLELSYLMKEHSRLIGEKHPINSDDVAKYVDLLTFLTN